MLVWRGGQTQDLLISVTLGAQGLGVFALERFDVNTGVYSPLGSQVYAAAASNPAQFQPAAVDLAKWAAALGAPGDAATPSGHAVFRVAATDLASWNFAVLVARLKIIGGNPASAAMPVFLTVTQAHGDLAPDDGVGNALNVPAQLSPNLPFNTLQPYDFQVWFP